MTETAGPERPGAADRSLADRIGEASRNLELGDPDVGLSRIERAINLAAEILGVGALVTIVVVIFLNAAGRYLLNTSLIWAEELVLLLVPWLAMTGMFLAVRRGTMIRIDFFYERMPWTFRAPLGPLGHLLCTAVLVFLAVVSTDYLLLFGADRTPYLDLPKGISSASFVVGGVAAGVAFLVALYKEGRQAR